MNFIRLWNRPCRYFSGGIVLTHPVLRHTNDAFLRNLFTITRFGPEVNGKWAQAAVLLSLPILAAVSRYYFWLIDLCGVFRG